MVDRRSTNRTSSRHCSELREASIQLSSRRKLYESQGRERLESKADLASRGVESPDRADALIGVVMMGIGSDPYALNPRSRQAMHEMMDQTIRRMKRNRSRFAVEHVNWELM